ncbi:MAG: hypothetical protein ACYDHP_09440 [Ferrimicrobium sp.]
MSYHFELNFTTSTILIRTPDHRPLLERGRPERGQPIEFGSNKISAATERYGPDENASARHKDLVDLVAPVLLVPLAVKSMRVALGMHTLDRDTQLPAQFSVF